MQPDTTAHSNPHYRKDTPVHNCPDCGERQIINSPTEYYCANCGLVLSEPLNHAQWSRSRSQGTDTVTQTGFDRTPTLHDKGLATVIDTNDTQKSKYTPQWSRLKRENRRSQASSRHTRNLRYALGELKRQTAALELSHSSLERAAALYHRLANDDTINGRNIDSLTSGSIYATTRINALPVLPHDIASVSRSSRNDILSAYRTILNEQNIPVPPEKPHTFLNRVASSVSASSTTIRSCRALLSTIEKDARISGHRPVVIAAAALYYVTHEENSLALQSDTTFTQQEIATVAHARRKTIRKATRVINAIESHRTETIQSPEHAALNYPPSTKRTEKP